MKSTVTKAITKGGEYLLEYGRDVEQACYRHLFLGEHLASVITVLAQYQNADGGFGHGLEPDLQVPDSSILATSEALILLRSLGVDPHTALFEGAIEFLLGNYQPEGKGWPFVPVNTDQFPRAPWWNYDPDVHSSRHNPRPQLLGDLIVARHLVPENLISVLADDVTACLKKDSGELQMHDLLSYLRLSRTSGLPQALRTALELHLPGMIGRNVETDPEQWSGYSLYPYQVVEHPDDPLMAEWGTAMLQSIRYMLDHQTADGCWEPTWDWGGQFLVAWEAAKKDWRSVITLNNLVVLKKFGAMVSS
ncbi:MAG: hypothetical protein HPY85_01080 [Anaerolineae bacterium]|nr:hypothetical protein [Anaerolineae bacterium]